MAKDRDKNIVGWVGYCYDEGFGRLDEPGQDLCVSMSKVNVAITG